MFDINNGYLNEFMSDLESSEFLGDLSLGGWSFTQFEIAYLKNSIVKNNTTSLVYDIKPVLIPGKLLGHTFKTTVFDEIEGEEIAIRFD